MTLLFHQTRPVETPNKSLGEETGLPFGSGWDGAAHAACEASHTVRLSDSCIRSHLPVEASGYGNNIKLLFRAPGNPGDVRLDNVIDPVHTDDEYWLNPRRPAVPPLGGLTHRF